MYEPISDQRYPMLEKVGHIFSISYDPVGFCISDEVDQNAVAELTRAQLIQLADELRAIADTTPAADESRASS